MLLEVQEVYVSLSLFSVCVLLLQVNLCEAAAISSFICRQVWQQGGRGERRVEEGGEERVAVVAAKRRTETERKRGSSNVRKLED